MTGLVALALAYAGLAALAAATRRHQRHIWDRNASDCECALLRLAGALSLALALTASVIQEGWAVGPVLWLGVLSAAGLATVLVLALRPRAVIASVVAVTLFASVVGACEMAECGVSWPFAPRPAIDR